MIGYESFHRTSVIQEHDEASIDDVMMMMSLSLTLMRTNPSWLTNCFLSHLSQRQGSQQLMK